jgi:hypothetical protein
MAKANWSREKQAAKPAAQEPTFARAFDVEALALKNAEGVWGCAARDQSPRACGLLRGKRAAARAGAFKALTLIVMVDRYVFPLIGITYRRAIADSWTKRARSERNTARSAAGCRGFGPC